MPILFSVVARGTVVLAKYATCAGNFTEVTEQILSKIPPHDNKLTYSHGNYLFHYISENKLVYFCITDDKFQRSRAFLFLNEIKRRFTTVFGDTAQTAIPYAMNSEFARVLATEMKHYSESKDLETISRVHGELDELKNIMVKNIDSMAMRGEKLELLVNKADNLATSFIGSNCDGIHYPIEDDPLPGRVRLIPLVLGCAPPCRVRSFPGNRAPSFTARGRRVRA
ncbi:unnamed protein product [Leptosia nina]|uniref:Vesicle-associated membrane protein 7 n=1 Tax=Leptosia nina TaxID=320188 RepID=A0AAV1JS23_9NEOP